MGAEQRDRLARLADVVIPGGGSMPSARDVGVHETGLDRVLEARPDLAESLDAVLAQPVDDPHDRLAALEADPAGRAALLTVLAGGYYLAPAVHTALGYPGLVALPVVGAEFPAYVAEGLLEQVTAPPDRRHPSI